MLVGLGTDGCCRSGGGEVVVVLLVVVVALDFDFRKDFCFGMIFVVSFVSCSVITLFSLVDVAWLVLLLIVVVMILLSSSSLLFFL